MEPQSFLLMFFCSIVSTARILATEHCDGVAEEGSDYTLTCRWPGSNQGMLWQLQTGTTFVDIATCTAPGSCTNSKPDSFVSSLVNGTDHDGVSLYTGQLRVVSVNRTKNTFRCLKLDRSQSVTCNLQVYVKTQKPTCQTPSLTTIGTETYLQVTCASERVYPTGGCNFTYKGLPPNYRTQISVNNTESSTSLGNYRTQCTWLARLSGLDPALVEVQAEVFPELPKWAETASSYSEWTPKVALDYPRVMLATTCPSGPSAKDGYILQGTVATCRCDLTSPGFPPGSAQWFSQDDRKLGVREDDGSATLTLSETGEGSSFVCRPVSVLNQAGTQVQDVHFNPQFAVGPTTLTIDLSDSFPLCPSESLMYVVTCKVQANNVVPSPLFTITINNKTVSSQERGQLDPLTRYHQFLYRFRPEAGGSLRVHCKAVNSIFPERFYDSERPYIIYEPPKQAPKLKTHNDQPREGSREAYITDKSNVHLTCVVEGGYPSVTNVTITCGSNVNTMSGSSAVISVVMPDSVHTLLCVCSAVHLTGCYHKRTEVVLTLKQQGDLEVNNNVNNSENSNNLSLGLGIGLGGAVVIIIILIIVFFIVHKRKERLSQSPKFDYNHPHFTSEPSYHYASVVQGTPVPPPSLHPDLLREGDYDLIALDIDKERDTTFGKYFPSQNESSTDQGPDITVSKHFPNRIESSTDQGTGYDLADGYIQPI